MVIWLLMSVVSLLMCLCRTVREWTVYSRIYIYIYIYIFHTHTHTHTYIYIYICVCVSVCLSVSVCVHKGIGHSFENLFVRWIFWSPEFKRITIFLRLTLAVVSLSLSVRFGRFIISCCHTAGPNARRLATTRQAM